LRQEFHWFIHDRSQWIPFNLFEPHFPYNRTKSKETIVAEETEICQEINRKSYVDILYITQKGTVHQIQKSKTIRINRKDSIQSNLFCLTEEQLIKKNFPKSCVYCRVPIQDHDAPDAQTFEVFKKIIEKHPCAWIHLHCKGGVGRTSLLLLLMDIVKHKRRFTFEEYVQRQIARGGANLRKYKYRERLEKIRKLTGF
jgi:protein-tyrosine phosphatase